MNISKKFVFILYVFREPAYHSYKPVSPRTKRHNIEKNVFGRMFPNKECITLLHRGVATSYSKKRGYNVW